ncbi:MAG: asparagine synthase (glutamine-hydrolyzing) [Reichenbachiella sp.]|uniref:asparagine synthase (glutamine-hydrolyzing) n=1 Tax=Reichenbachiella sp. TaxID=2184521 RepID=UPI003265F3A2
MCGIAGVFNGNEEFNQKLLLSSGDRLKERGPDYQGHLRIDRHTLFHSRLKIIDLTDSANQPMSLDQYHLVFNGEIYNFLALKKKLQLLGAQFKTHSDTEVILVGYHHWGIDQLLLELDGMFAFCLFDEKANQVFLVRDRLGKKPLYYFQEGQLLSFSSDIRVLHDMHKSALSTNLTSVFYYLSELSMPQPYSIYNEVSQIKPAHYIRFDLKSATSTEQCYWQVPLQKHTLTLNETIEETEALLLSAIKRRLVADVPVGCFLSGGVDSGLIVALAAQNSSKPISTFTVGLDYAPYNELDDARIVADRYQTNHNEIVVKPNITEDIEGLMKYTGEPFADSSLLPSYYITKEISQHITVALSGDGGDEGFGGYNDYGLAHRSEKYYAPLAKSKLSNARVGIDKVKHRLLRRPGDNMGSYQQYFQKEDSHKLFRDMAFFPSDQHDLWASLSNYSQGHDFVLNYWDQVWQANRHDTKVDSLMQASLQTRLLNDYLVKVDRSSMINSLEVRSPFLDTSLLSFAMNIPHELKFHKDINKFILKKIAQKHVDPNIDRRPKRGFGIPIHLWLKKELKSYSQEVILNSPFIMDHFEKSTVEKILKQHQSGEKIYTHQIWALLCLSLWQKSIQ